jgi:hypothetical protein
MHKKSPWQQGSLKSATQSARPLTWTKRHPSALLSSSTQNNLPLFIKDAAKSLRVVSKAKVGNKVKI